MDGRKKLAHSLVCYSVWAGKGLTNGSCHYLFDSRTRDHDQLSKHLKSARIALQLVLRSEQDLHVRVLCLKGSV